MMPILIYRLTLIGWENLKSINQCGIYQMFSDFTIKFKDSWELKNILPKKINNKKPLKKIHNIEHEHNEKNM